MKPATDPKNTTVEIGDVSYEAKDTGNGTSLGTVSIILLYPDVHPQIYLDLLSKTALVDLVFATFNNGSHINSVESVQYVAETVPKRLRGEKNFEMENVLDIFILSQNGEHLARVATRAML